MFVWQAIPSPDSGVWNLGPIPLLAYAIAIILGIVVAVWLGDKRWRKFGGNAAEISDIAVWAIPFGIIGGRIYHVATDPQLYFAAGKNTIDANRASKAVSKFIESISAMNDSSNFLLLL